MLIAGTVDVEILGIWIAVGVIVEGVADEPFSRWVYIVMAVVVERFLDTIAGH
jgi:hypothetical protein